MRSSQWLVALLVPVLCIAATPTDTATAVTTVSATPNPQLISLLQSALTDGEGKCSDGEGFGPLNDLLSSFKINIPDIDITTIKDIKYLNSSKIECHDVTIGDVELAADGPKSKPIIALNLSGIAVDCTFSIVADVIGIKANSDVTAKLTNIGGTVGAALTFDAVPG